MRRTWNRQGSEQEGDRSHGRGPRPELHRAGVLRGAVAPRSVENPGRGGPGGLDSPDRPVGLRRGVPQVKAGPSASDLAETAVARFYKSLSKTQREQLCFPFDHPLRSVVKNNWDIVKPTISDMNKEQQALCREIMKNLCSEDGYERFMKQMEDDAGGFDAYHVAVFGEPGTDKPFEWVLTGRHDTLRADGNSLEGAAFGGPIFYGHAADGHFNEDAKHTNNVWWYQGEQANKIFQTLDDKQKARALVNKAEEDDARIDQAQGRQAAGPGPGRRRPGQPAEGDGPPARGDDASARSGPATPPRSASASTPPAARTSFASPTTRKAISATTASGTSGRSRAPRSPGTSAALPTSTPG